MITKTDIEHIAKLSRLEFSSEELDSFKNDLNQIVTYVNEIQKVDTTGNNNHLLCVNAQTQLRPDQQVQWFSQQEATKNAPMEKGGAFFVPPVVE